MLFLFVRISYNQKPRGLLRLVPFIKATLEVVALISLAWLTQVTWRYSYMYSHQFWRLWSSWELGYEVLINYVITWHTGMIYRNIKTSYNKSCDIKQWYYVFQPSLVIASLWKLRCNVLNLVITWSKVMSPNGCMQFHPSHQIWFTCLFWNL